MSAHRREQVASTIRRVVQNALVRGFADPRIRGLVTVTEVEVSHDLRDAQVHVSVLPERYEAATIAGLKAATLKIQRVLNEEMEMRRPPHLHFFLDQRLKKQAAVYSAIREAIEGPGASPAADSNDAGSESDPDSTDRSAGRLAGDETGGEESESNDARGG